MFLFSNKYCKAYSFVLFLLWIHLPKSCSFNFNMKTWTEFSPKDYGNYESYFGYSVLLNGGEHPILIVGAPQATSDHWKKLNISNPGSLYKCDIKISNNNDAIKCKQMLIHPTGDTKENFMNDYLQHAKSKMWLGMSLEDLNHNYTSVLACAPRWINQLYTNKYFMNGLCYAVNHNTSEVEMLIPLLNKDLQVLKTSSEKIYYLVGEAGFSLKVSESKTELLMGAPGINKWRGSIVRYRIIQDSGKFTFSVQNIPNTTYLSELLPIDSYFGYSVGIGNFLKDKPDLYVAGAPRGSMEYGQVLIFDFPSASSDRLIVHDILKGHQLGEYFGSVLYVVDIDNDGVKDLLVGAPMYSYKSSFDQGKVYVYMNKPESSKIILTEQKANIVGDENSGARFGSCFALLGDIDKDGYSDIAIGAPYDDDGKGAVYIYLGSSKGLNPSYSQRITITNTMGFGISISRGVPLDSCNNIAVGAYESNKVILIRCHPVIKIYVDHVTYPQKVTFLDKQFILKVCVNLTGPEKSSINVNAKLSLDSTLKRAIFNESKTESFNFNVSGIVGKKICTNFSVLIKDVNEENAMKPLRNLITYTLIQDTRYESKFCSDCGVISPLQKNYFNVQLSLEACGADRICQPDLKVRLSLTEKVHVIGSSKNITANISITNVGEPIIQPYVHVILHESAFIQRVPSKCHIDINSNLKCQIMALMHNDTEKDLTIIFDTSSLTSKDTSLRFLVNVTSGQNELTPEDNYVNMTIPLIIDAAVNIKGNILTPADKEIRFNTNTNRNLTISHTYMIHKSGLTYLDDFYFRFFIPIEYTDSTTNTIHSIVDTPIFKGESIINSFNCYVLESGFDVDEEIIKTDSTTQRIIDNQNSNLYKNTEPDLEIQSLYINCTDKMNVKCLVMECQKPGGIESGISDMYTIFHISINVANTEYLLQNEPSIFYSTYATIYNPNKKRKMIGWVQSQLILEKTLTAIPFWLFFVGILLGVGTLALITYGLYKCNFFKRNVKAEMKHLINEDRKKRESQIQDINGSPEHFDVDVLVFE